MRNVNVYDKKIHSSSKKAIMVEGIDKYQQPEQLKNKAFDQY